MSLRFYFTFVAVCCVFTPEINGQSANGFASMFSFLTEAGGSNDTDSQSGPQSFLSSTCPYSPSITCAPSPKFRSIDGSCNDGSSPYSGKSETPYIRIGPPMYQDGKSIPRNSSFFGYSLPIPRKISLDYFNSTDGESTTLSGVTPVFARFVEHDLYKTKLLDANACCSSDKVTGVCDNINIPVSDPFFGTYKVTCLPKAKSASSPPLDCKQGVSQQVNENTHLLDLSNIYGSTKAVSDKLRTKTDGLLKMSAINDDLLSKDDFPDCQLPTPNPNNEHCFLAGDQRVNNDPLIMTMYTVWVRHHNAIAKELKAILKDGDDENIFQTARKIVIAHYQHIVYTELLPTLDSTLPLKPATPGIISASAAVKPVIINTFTIGYTGIVDSMVPLEFKVGEKTLKLEDVWYKPEELWKVDGTTNLLKAMLEAKSQKIDRFVVPALIDTYLQIAPGRGTDKVALNLQQSRENGATSYMILNAVLKKSFSILSKYNQLTELEATASTELQKLYLSVFDIEFLPGLLGENPATDAEYGPMMQKIMNKQFLRLKDGDSFFYSRPGIFTTAQLDDIEDMTLGKILCTHGPLENVLKQVLKQKHTTNNPEAKCSDITGADICAWSTVDWSDWSSLGCFGGMGVSVRQCKILPGSKCKCDGEPIKFASCPSSLLQNLVSDETKNKLNNTFYTYFDANGNALNPNSTESVADILRKVQL